MELNRIDGALFEKLLTFGALNLQASKGIINELNVFPVPDGDTGDNMLATIVGGVESLKKTNEELVGQKASLLANGMLLNARGNSGVILSQLFYGIALGLKDKQTASALDFALALKSGVEYGYKAVVKPVEGTILTVAREASEKVNALTTEETSLEEFFKVYLQELKTSLERTPELLATLKEAGVVDSGGAGLVCIAEGFYKAIIGEESFGELAFTSAEEKCAEEINFDASSKMDFGYCTEVLLQLLDSKDGVKNFNLNNFIYFLSTLGDSVVAVQTEDKVKIHVHTLTPAVVLTESQKYGEFISVKIENMTLQHNNTLTEKEKPTKRVHCAIVAVASGSGFAKIYTENGADYIVSGGQTDNPSTEDFIRGFEQVNADYIIVLPNNKNIVLAAKQAGDLYKDSEVIVLPTKTPQQVYSALMVVALKDDAKSLVEDMEGAIESVDSYSITYSIRDAHLNDIDIKKGDYMAFSPKGIMLENKDKLECFKQLLLNAEDVYDKEIITVFYGADITEEEKEVVREFIEENFGDAELVEFDGGQEVYSFLIALE